MSIALALHNYERQFVTNERTVKAVENINLLVQPGEFVTIVGPSGCGKSTLLRAIAGLDTQHTGEVSANQQIVRGPDISRGVIFQEPRLFPWLTVRQNIGFGLRLPAQQYRSRIEELIELVGLHGFEHSYPHQLSGGMAQRVAIARALAPRPEALLLDEPFSALDTFTRIHLQNSLQHIWQAQNITAILVTHDIDEAITLGQRVIVMSPRPGRISQELHIDLPYPRVRASERFSYYRQNLLTAFGLHTHN